jgi:hypothetical protein
MIGEEMKVLKVVLLLALLALFAKLFMAYEPSPWVPPDYSGEVRK